MNEKKAKKKLKKMEKRMKEAIIEIWGYPKIRNLVADALMLEKYEFKKKKAFKKVMKEIAKSHISMKMHELEKDMIAHAKYRKQMDADSVDEELLEGLASRGVIDPDDDSVVHKLSHNKTLHEVFSRL
jgi:hypothetical protein